jgi:hypothetical protein
MSGEAYLVVGPTIILFSFISFCLYLWDQRGVIEAEAFSGHWGYTHTTRDQGINKKFGGHLHGSVHTDWYNTGIGIIWSFVFSFSSYHQHVLDWIPRLFTLAIPFACPEGTACCEF